MQGVVVARYKRQEPVYHRMLFRHQLADLGPEERAEVRQVRHAERSVQYSPVGAAGNGVVVVHHRGIEDGSGRCGLTRVGILGRGGPIIGDVGLAVLEGAVTSVLERVECIFGITVATVAPIFERKIDKAVQCLLHIACFRQCLHRRNT